MIAALLLGACSGSDGAATSTSTTVEVVTTPAPTSTSTTLPPSTTTASTVPPTTAAPTTTSAPPRSGAPTAAEQAVLESFATVAAAQRPGLLRAVGVAIVRGDTAIGGLATGATAGGTPLTSASPFRLASVSKVLTAVVVLQLVDEGRLGLDDSVAAAWPSPAPPMDPVAATITIRQLLQHTSGFAPFRPQFFGDQATDWRTNARYGLATTPTYPPGTEFHYSNMNFVILASLAEAITGDTIDRLVQARVAEPLGLTSLHLDQHTAPTDADGPAYVVDPTRRYIEALGPAGSWVGSAEDMARVLAALRPGSVDQLLPDELLAEMRTPTPLPNKDEDWQYGLGLMVGHGWVGHSGTIEDVRTVTIRLDNGYSVAILVASTGLAEGEALLTTFALPVLQLAVLPPV